MLTLVGARQVLRLPKRPVLWRALRGLARERHLRSAAAAGSPMGLTEREIQRRVVAIFRAAGWHVTVFSQHRKRHINAPTAGVPDLYVIRPGRDTFWFETKGPSGKQSAAQQDFQACVQEAGVGYGLGGEAEARALVSGTLVLNMALGAQAKGPR